LKDNHNGLVINLHNVVKIYRGNVHALRGITMRVHGGEIFGLLGPNGAGKSTLVKIIMTVIRANRAEGEVLGHPIGHNPTLGRIGYLPEHHRFAGYLTGRQSLEFYAALSRVDRRTRKRRALELLEAVDMSKWADAKIRTYSKGMTQRLGIAQALINAPDLIVLDEPGEGLDPLGRRQVRELLLNLRRQGKTIFVNSHLLGELEMICQRIAILVAGQVVRQGALDDLTQTRQFYQIDLHSDEFAVDPQILEKALSCQLHTIDQPSISTSESEASSSQTKIYEGILPHNLKFELIGNRICVQGSNPQQIQPLIDALRKHNLTISSVQPIRQSLEDLFLETIGDLKANSHSATATSNPGRTDS